MNKVSSQLVPETNHGQNNQPHKVSWGLKFMFIYLYFMQGFILSIATTIIYIYPTLPDYFIISLFSLSVIPFSFKFLTAPILQKYSSITYGKRKAWIIISQMLMSIMIFVCSFYTLLEQAKIFALLSIFTYLALSFQDISLDALCLKEFKSPDLMSVIQGASQSSGNVIGSLLMLKLTSIQFANWLGLNSPITSLQKIMLVLSIMMLAPTIIIHFKFVETYSQAEENRMKQSICEVYSLYRFFLKKQYKYCRVVIFNLIFYQGFNFFFAGYSIELIKAGFSRNMMNTIDTIQNIIIFILMFSIGTYANAMGFKKSFLTLLGLLWLLTLYLWIFFPLNIWIVIVTNFLMAFFIQWNFLVGTNLSADFPQTGATGMIYTMNASSFNFGRQIFIHTAILKIYPWRTMGIIGLGLQALLIVLFVPKMLDLVSKGQTNILKQEEQQGNYNQLNQEHKS